MAEQWLTPHFTHKELDVEGAEGRVVFNARRLCDLILEPVRAHYSVPLHVTSGYRSAEHNRDVGGKSNSFHLYENCKAAADFCIPGIPVTQLFSWMRMVSGLPFDKIILERRDDVPRIVHVQIDHAKPPRRLAYIGETGNATEYKQVEVK